MVTNFSLNGNHYRFYHQLTLHELLIYFNYSNKIFVVEYNNLICKQNDWKFKTLKNNDKIEIISIVGGG